MKTYSSTFITWYFNEFQQDALYVAMSNTSENSLWHRERSVGTHTDMVVSEYACNTMSLWTKMDLLGAFACAFHDVGKPAARQEKESEARGVYYSFSGHEQLSARLWEDWAARNWSMLQASFDLTVIDLYKVTWMIEHHRPWGLQKPHKREAVHASARLLVGIGVYTRMLRADNWGRMGDTQDANMVQVNDWITEFTTNVEFNVNDWNVSDINYTIPHRHIDPNAPTLSIVIGCSGSGKSTFTNSMELLSFSWDALRLEWYDPTNYDNAWTLASQDSTFMERANAEFQSLLKTGDNLVVDNTNLSAKRRRNFIEAAKRAGYNTVGVTFPSSIATVVSRQKTRTDKEVHESIVRNQYMSTAQPQLGEFDSIIVVDSNL